MLSQGLVHVHMGNIDIDIDISILISWLCSSLTSCFGASFNVAATNLIGNIANQCFFEPTTHIAALVLLCIINHRRT